MKKSDIIKIFNIVIFIVISTILMKYNFAVLFAPQFLKVDLSDCLAVFATFYYGPIYGVIIELFKNILILFVKPTSTNYIGELANFLMGGIYVLVIGIINDYSKKTKMNRFIRYFLIIVLSVFTLGIVGTIINKYLLFPVFAKSYHLTMNDLVEFGRKSNPYVTSLNSLMYLSVFPFNLIKGLVNIITGGIMYRTVVSILEEKKKDNENGESLSV